MTTILVAILLVLAGVQSHMEMIEPPPIKSKNNKYYNFEGIDYSYNDPLGIFPCKGYHVNEPRISTQHYLAGQSQKLVIEGTADHDGGSCQISLSYDQGTTFHVIKSIIGGCPIQRTYDFVIPHNAPHGQALLSWTWISRIGNRNLYQNCAWVDIINLSNVQRTETNLYGRERGLSATTPKFGPPMFVAQVPGSCVVAEGYEYIYPEPGPQVEYGGDPENYTIVCEECFPTKPSSTATQYIFGSDIQFWKNEYNMTCVIKNRQKHTGLGSKYIKA